MNKNPTNEREFAERLFKAITGSVLPPKENSTQDSTQESVIDLLEEHFLGGETMTDYPYTQADKTPYADYLANEIGARKAEIADLRRAHYINSKYTSRPSGLERHIKELEKSIRKLETELKNHPNE